MCYSSKVTSIEVTTGSKELDYIIYISIIHYIVITYKVDAFFLK